MDWQKAILTKETQLAPDVKALTFAFEAAQVFLPGQYYELRLLGAQSDRPYSVASAPIHNRELEFAIQLLPGGKVSPLLWDLKVGDSIEARGPWSEEIIWRSNLPFSELQKPTLLIGGGTGVAPLISILRHEAEARSNRHITALFSFKTKADWLYRQEIEQFAKAQANWQFIITFTQISYSDVLPSTTLRINENMRIRLHFDRIDQALLETIFTSRREVPRVYVCGGTAFVEFITQQLLLLNVDFQNVFAERFG